MKIHQVVFMVIVCLWGHRQGGGGTSAWDKIKSPSTNAKFLQQFTSYLSSGGVSSLGDLAYIVNTDKASIAYVKGAFKGMIGKTDPAGNFVLTSAGTNVFDTIWSNINLRNDIWNPSNFPTGLTKIQAKSLFLNLVDSESFFSFIK